MTSFVFTQTIYIFGIANKQIILKKKVILSQEYKKKHYFFFIQKTCSVFSYINNFE